MSQPCYYVGHVGGPLTGCEVKLVDIPEMSYTNADLPNPRGEVSPGTELHQNAVLY